MWVPIPFEQSFRMAYSRTRYGTGYYIYHQFVDGAPLSQPDRALGRQDAARPGRARADEPRRAATSRRRRAAPASSKQKSALDLPARREHVSGAATAVRA